MSQLAANSPPVNGPNVSMIELDIRGQICPSALLIALREVNQRKLALKTGSVCLRVRTDNRDSTITIPDALTNMGYAVKVTKDDGHYLVEIRSRATEG